MYTVEIGFAQLLVFTWCILAHIMKRVNPGFMNDFVQKNVGTCVLEQGCLGYLSETQSKICSRVFRFVTLSCS